MGADREHANEEAVRVAARLIALELQTHSSDALLCTFRTATGTELDARLWPDSPLWLRWARRLRIGVLYDLLVRHRPGGDRLVELLQIRTVPEPERAEGEAEQTAEVWFAQLRGFLEREVRDDRLKKLVQAILSERREPLLGLPASHAFHHVLPGGLVQHTLAVVRIATRMADELVQAYPALRRYLRRDLVICGAALHDLGKVEELLHRQDQEDAAYLAGRLLGHWVTLQDSLLQHGASVGVDPNDLAVLRHIVYSHQTTQRGGPADPQCLEGLIVAAADGLDSHVDAALRVIQNFRGDFGVTSPRNPLGRRLLVRRLT